MRNVRPPFVAVLLLSAQAAAALADDGTCGSGPFGPRGRFGKLDDGEVGGVLSGGKSGSLGGIKGVPDDAATLRVLLGAESSGEGGRSSGGPRIDWPTPVGPRPGPKLPPKPKFPPTLPRNPSTERGIDGDLYEVEDGLKTAYDKCKPKPSLHCPGVLAAEPDQGPIRRKWWKCLAGLTTTVGGTNCVGSAVYVGDGRFVGALHVFIENLGALSVRYDGGVRLGPKAAREAVILATAERDPSSTELPRHQFAIDWTSVRCSRAYDLVTFKATLRAPDDETPVPDAFEAVGWPADGFRVTRNQDRLAVLGFKGGDGSATATADCLVVSDVDAEWTCDVAKTTGPLRALGSSYLGYSGGPMIDMRTGALLGVFLAQTDVDVDSLTGKAKNAGFFVRYAFGGVDWNRVAAFLRDVATGLASPPTSD